MIFYAISALFLIEGGHEKKNSFFVLALVYGWIAWGIHKKSLGFTIFGLTLFLISTFGPWIYQFLRGTPSTNGFSNRVIDGFFNVPFLIAFILSIYGVRSYSKFEHETRNGSSEH
jgi:hypothetical protein